MHLDRIAAVCDVGDVDRHASHVDGNTAAFRDRGAERDVQMLGCGRIGTAYHNGLVSLIDLDVFQIRKHGKRRVHSEFVRRSPKYILREVNVDQAVGFVVLVLNTAHEYVF